MGTYARFSPGMVLALGAGADTLRDAGRVRADDATANHG